MLPVRLLSGVVVLMACAGCTSYPGMFFAEHTHVGAQIKISPQPDAKPLDVNIGYDRGLVALVPRTGEGENAGSVLSKTDLDIVFLTNSTIKNVFATGVAAKILAKDGAHVAALFGQCYGETETLKKAKQAAWEKLVEHKKKDDDDSKGKVTALYQSVFPKQTVHWTTTKDEMIRVLIDRINAVCDSDADLKTLDQYTTTL